MDTVLKVARSIKQEGANNYALAVILILFVWQFHMSYKQNQVITEANRKLVATNALLTGTYKDDLQAISDRVDQIYTEIQVDNARE